MQHPGSGSIPGPRGERVVDRVLDVLVGAGATAAFGVIGGAIVPFCEALATAPLRVVPCRHEGGAAYAATEQSLAADAPAIVYTTTGPGLTNALTGLLAAREEGARVVLISGMTAPHLRRRCALQESTAVTLPGLYEGGRLFDDAFVIEHPAETPAVLRALARGLRRPGGYVAHLALPLSVQGMPAPAPGPAPPASPEPAPPPELVEAIVERLGARFGVWIGHGARRHAGAVRRLLEETSAPNLTTPRAKGIVREGGPGWLGVTGMGGHDDIGERLRELGVETLLVLGSRLGECATSHDEGLIPPGGFVHVDLDPDVPGQAFPRAPVLPVHAGVGPVLAALAGRLPGWCGPSPRPRPEPSLLRADAGARVHPGDVIAALNQLVEARELPLLAEAGNAYTWATHSLRLSAPRYRAPGMWSAMGHMAAGAIGATLAGPVPRRVVALVGDGAFLMQDEVSTAAHLGLPVTWVVLNDSRFGMVAQGLEGLGREPADVAWPEVDFVARARSVGADGLRVTRADQLPGALDLATRAAGPFIVDVVIDPHAPAPFVGRIRSLAAQAKEHP